MHAGLTCLRRHDRSKSWDSRWLAEHDVHVHYPGPAAHADGPSAGLVMFLALSSYLQDLQPPSDIAVTGEVSIHGLVYAVGGIGRSYLRLTAKG